MFGTIEAASIAEALKTIREDTEIVDCTINGQCSNCGGCCANLLPMTPREIDAIRKYVKSHGIKPKKHFIPSRNPVYDMVCPFRDNTNRCCTIYDVRPHVCRVWNCGAALRGEQFDMTLFTENGVEPIYVRETFFGRDLAEETKRGIRELLEHLDAT